MSAAVRLPDLNFQNLGAKIFTSHDVTHELSDTNDPLTRMSPTTITISLGIGAMSGVVAALCGVGGGVVMVPCFVFLLHLGQKDAVATSLMAMIGTAIVASIQNQRNGFGDWKIAAVTMCGAMITAYMAADWLKKLSSERLTQIFGLILVVMGLRMLILGKS